MIVWTTGGLYSLVSGDNGYFINVEARDQIEADSLRSTLRLLDLEDEIQDEWTTRHGYVIQLIRSDALKWVDFELEHWSKESLASQLGANDTKGAIALEKLMMNLEK